MKTTIKELEVDFIGGQEPLTVQEENALSAYFKKKKTEKVNSTEKKKTKLHKVN
ncbi:hypothetical protein [Pedobacter puniceum]|uniref:Uncharacterized protein n=1 Tax=Pedobacter puniceum TaxID=2666136 RepID=A0A7K0FJX9_9SPHI|nr:hypothetical protein [Pedobacter puniceum]MRX46213.1 hypothetical protein [Pedobacter puniceum]